MLKELFDAINQQAVNASELQVIHKEPDAVHIVNRDGTFTRLPIAPPKRKIQAHSLQALIGGEKDFPGVTDKAAMFYSMSAVTLVFDAREGYETATLALKPTEEIVYMRAQTLRPNVPVSNLVLAGQTTLRACRSEDDMAKFVAGVGKLTAVMVDRKGVESARGLDKLSRQVTETADELAHLPAELQTFYVRPFAVPGLDFRLPLTCVLLPRASEASWFFQPLPDSLLQFEALALEQISELLEESECPVYHGQFA